VKALKRLRYFPVDNIRNEDDVKKVHDVISSMDGVERVEVDLDAGAVEVEYDDEKVTKEMMAKILQSHGYLMRI